MITIIDYGSGNVRSVQNALKRLGTASLVSMNIDEIQHADKLIFPGVGHAHSALEALSQNGLDKLIPQLKQPVLGICLGMQLMCAQSEETLLQTLQLFATDVKRFDQRQKVPHMGWNSTELETDNPLFQGMASVEDFYYVHSYYAEKNADSIASCEYGNVRFSAGINKDNFYALQFHPEKSGDAGAQILQNFIQL